jgi:hypothetical protein
MAWLILYQHPLRPDEAGVKSVRDQSAVAEERSRLESSGYVVVTVAQSLQATLDRLLPKPLTAG